MKENNYVTFKEERDLGAIITDTFKFIRLEWKSFFSYIFKIAIVPILVWAAAVLYNSYSITNTLSDLNLVDKETITPSTLFSYFGDVLASSLILMICYLIAYVMVSLGALFYIKSYIENDGVVDYNSLKKKVLEKFWSFIGLGFLIGITIFIGCLLCGFPGIYFYVVFSISFCLLVFQNESVSNSYGNSFSFINGHWWETFGCLIVVGILVTIIGYIFSIPAVIYQLIQGMSLIGSDDPTEIISMFSDPIYSFLNVVVAVGQFFLHAVTLISTVLIYFDINEQKNASGTYDQIDGLGR